MIVRSALYVAIPLTAVFTFGRVASADVAPPDACYAVDEPCTWDAGDVVTGVCRTSMCTRPTPDGSTSYDCLRCVKEDTDGSTTTAIPSSTTSTTTISTIAPHTSGTTTSEAVDADAPTSDWLDADAPTSDWLDAIAPPPSDAATIRDAGLDASLQPDAMSDMDGGLDSHETTSSDAHATSSNDVTTSTNEDASITPTVDAGSDGPGGGDSDCNCSVPGQRNERWLSSGMLALGFVALQWSRRRTRS